MPNWLVALIVGLVYAALAAGLYFAGKERVQEGGATHARADSRNHQGGREMGQDPDRIRQQLERTREQ